MSGLRRFILVCFLFSCVVEFSMETAIRRVECVPWYMPQNGSLAICGPWQTSLFQKVMSRAFSEAHSVSSCLPDCHSVKYSYSLSMARFRRCDQRNLNYSPLCSLQPKFSPAPWQVAGSLFSKISNN